MFVNNLNFPLIPFFPCFVCSHIRTSHIKYTHIYLLTCSFIHTRSLYLLWHFFFAKNSFGCWFGKLIVHCCSLRYWNIVSTYMNVCVCIYVCISICVCVCGCILVENNNFSDLRYVQTLDNGTNN